MISNYFFFLKKKKRKGDGAVRVSLVQNFFPDSQQKKRRQQQQQQQQQNICTSDCLQPEYAFSGCNLFTNVTNYMPINKQFFSISSWVHNPTAPH